MEDVQKDGCCNSALSLQISDSSTRVLLHCGFGHALLLLLFLVRGLFFRATASADLLPRSTGRQDVQLSELS